MIRVSIVIFSSYLPEALKGKARVGFRLRHSIEALNLRGKAIAGQSRCTQSESCPRPEEIW